MRTLTRLSVALMCGALLPVLACADPAMTQKLPGLWGSENSYGPAVRGTLTVDGRQAHWRAGIAGFDVRVEHAGGRVSFSLPGGQGEFRGELQADGREIRGQWIQPRGVTNNNNYATPVTLTRGAEPVWQGEVTPLPDRLSLYLLITRQPDGTLNAALRNPEFNLGRHGAYAVTMDGDHVRLVRGNTDTLSGSYDPAADSLTLTSTDLGGTFTLTRRNRDQALGFYAVTPVQESYVYRQPVLEPDGWATGTLADAGLDPKPLQALMEKLLTEPYSGPHTPYIHSLLLARHGKLVLEQYFYGYDRARTHSTRSAGKTFAGVLLGIALDHGAKLKLDAPAIAYFPQYRDIANLDSRKRSMTVRDLLTMTSGLACDDNDDSSPGNEDNMQQQTKQPDWYRYTLDLPMTREPGGSQAVYCSAGINLLGGIIRGAGSMPLPEFFARYYARPLGLGVYHMNLMPTGEAYMAGGIEMTPRDLLKLGQLYLDGGMWDGRRVVSTDWVKASWQMHSRFEPGHGYGYAWHIVDIESGGRTYRLYEAGGNGGQFVIAIPALDMVIGITAGNYGDFPTWYKFMTQLVPQYIIPAAAGG